MRFIFDKRVMIKRPTLATNTEEYEDLADINCKILPVKAEDVILTEGDPLKSFKLVCDINENIKEADLIIDGDDKYIIKTLRRFTFKSLSRIEGFIYKTTT